VTELISVESVVAMAAYFGGNRPPTIATRLPKAPRFESHASHFGRGFILRPFVIAATMRRRMYHKASRSFTFNVQPLPGLVRSE